ncbi:MAG: M48 family metallopeptidase [bacterium]|nr:M48 family metallopeptidase [bacterium]
MRFDSVGNTFKLTIPPRASQKKIKEFLRECDSWILKQFSTSMDPVIFKNGLILPVLGKDYKIVHQLFYSRRRVFIEKNSIIVQGIESRVNDLVVTFLKQFAKDEFTHICEKYASQIGKEVRKISIRDTKTRWGSCSKIGNISLCWRLLLTPRAVAEYVCIHEVAHLKEMNHSADFWGIVGGLHPQYNQSKEWLTKNGKALFRYGKSP